MTPKTGHKELAEIFEAPRSSSCIIRSFRNKKGERALRLTAHARTDDEADERLDLLRRRGGKGELAQERRKRGLDLEDSCSD